MRFTSPLEADELGTLQMVEHLANQLSRIQIDDLDGAADKADDIDALKAEAMRAVNILLAWHGALHLASLRRREAVA